jgi:membrane associated rhomboid family serine protease
MAFPMTIQVETCYRHPDRETRVHCTRCGRPICSDCMTQAPVGHHCPSCVAEGRRGVRRVRPVIPRPRSATTAILAVNVAAFVLDLVLRTLGAGSLLEAGAMIPGLVAGGEWWRLFTAMFLHVGVLHLALNSFGLYLFGNLVEQTLGTARMLAMYLVTGFCASVASFTFGPAAVAAVGASGAVFGMLGAWLAYNLRRRSLRLARANVQWALMLIGINLVFGLSVPGIDNLAHIGGLVTGVLAGLGIEGVAGRTRTASAAVTIAALATVAVVLATWRASTL